MGNDPGGSVYLLLGRLFKVHAIFDDVLLALLERDPTGVVAFIAEPQEPLTALAWGRLDARAAATDRSDLMDRVRPVDYWNYANVLSNARVILDTHPYGGCLTALDALSNGVPLVVLPGPSERGRHAASIYKQMGLEDFVASNAEEYVEVAARLGTDDAFHRDAVATIRSRYPDAHRAPELAAEWAAAFLRMARGAR